MTKPKISTEIITNVLEKSSSNPHGLATGNNILKATETVTGLVNTVLLPIAALNFGAQKARDYFEEKFMSDIEAKTAHIPGASLVAPPPSLAAPILQGLAFSHGEDELREMYLNLLGTAMDARKEGVAHPAFVEVVRQMSAEEAKLLNVALSGSYIIPTVEVRLYDDEQSGFDTLDPHLTNLYELAGAPYSSRLSMYLDNWIRMGIFVFYDSHSVNPDDGEADPYGWAEAHPSVLHYQQSYSDERYRLSLLRGLIQRTSFGSLFGEAVGLNIPPLKKVSLSDDSQEL